MKGLIISLIPKDASGIERNKRFLASNTLKLTMGRGEIQEDGTLKCIWGFERVVPDKLIERIEKTFTKNLDEAKKREDNFTYEVERIK